MADANTGTSTPVIGQFWRFHDGSPWPSDFRPVRVTDVKEGWVRYATTGIPDPDDRRCTVDTFLTLFRPHQEPQTYAEAMQPGSGFSYSEPVRDACGCGRKQCAGNCTSPLDRRADLGSVAGQ